MRDGIKYIQYTVFRIRIHFLRIWIRIQRLRLETNTDPDTDPDPIRIQGFNDQKLKKKYSWKNFLFFFDQTAIYLSLGLHKVCPGYRRSLQLTKEAIQHFKTWIFSSFVGHFCPPGSGSGSGFRIRIRIHWPDWIRIQYGSGSRSGSETLTVQCYGSNNGYKRKSEKLVDLTFFVATIQKNDKLFNFWIGTEKYEPMD